MTYMILLKVMKNLKPEYIGNRKVWSPNGQKTKVISLPHDFDVNDSVHIWKIDDDTLIITKLSVFEFVKKVIEG